MIRCSTLLFLAALSGLSGSYPALTSAANELTAAADPSVPDGFSAATAEVNGASIYYLLGGSGTPVVLLHGFPQDHSAWRNVAPGLIGSYTVIIPDLRGIGRSQAPRGGPFDASTLAADVRQLLATLGLKSPYVVGHDMGDWLLSRCFGGAQ